MKKYLMFFSAAALALSTAMISSCSDDEGGGGSKEIPAALVKTLTIDEVTWEFTYDAANDDRLTSVLVTGDGDPYTITYDYSVPNRLTEREGEGDDGTVFELDGEGRIVKQFWGESEDEFEGFEYDDDGFMIRWYESIDGDERDYWTAEIEDDNFIVHTEYNGDGSVYRTKTFTYLSQSTALNVSNLPQANLRNSERRTISGLYGKGSRKLVDYLELDYTDSPDGYRKNKNTYTFDSETNQVTKIVRTGVDKDNNPTDLNEEFTYTYYPIEE